MHSVYLKKKKGLWNDLTAYVTNRNAVPKGKNEHITNTSAYNLSFKSESNYVF